MFKKDNIERNKKFVEKVITLEPFDKKNVLQKHLAHNLCLNLVSTMKQSTQEYYNMRITLVLECG